jgi:hypothetical protein
MIIGGIFWSITYILIIRQGYKDKTYSMPLVALCANISWEAIFLFVHPHSPPQLYINYVWFILDALIVLQVLKFGKSEFPNFSIKQFIMSFVFALVLAFCSRLFITNEFNDWKGAYAAFGQNLMMSILFISMLLNRNSLRGQSIYIAIFKLLGTGVSSLAFYLYQPISQGSLLMPFLYISIFVCDIIYLSLIYQKYKEHKLQVFGNIVGRIRK